MKVIYPLLFPILFALPFWLSAQTAGLDQSVMMHAVAYEAPARIQLKWLQTVTCQGFIISRKKKTDDQFTVLVPDLSKDSISWTDYNVELGQEYEYRVYRYGGAGQWGGPNGWGYVSAGIRVKPDPWKGNLLLLVDSSLVNHALTRQLIWQWKQDVTGEGWDVQQLAVLPTESVVAVKQKLWQLNKMHSFRSVFILGRVPIPYSGNIAPDEHADHRGAWPTDAFYADTVNLTWPDTDQNIITASDPRNHNVPGDGKFDLSGSIRQLEIGRVDMRNLPMFALTEAALIRRYLLKNHAFRTAEIKVEDRAMHDDQATGLNFGATAWRGYSTLCRNWNIPFSPYGTIGTGNFRISCRNYDFLWSGSWGPGSYTSVGSNNSTLFLSDSLRTVFTAFLGSYFGDWDSPTNNFLRSALGNKGPILTSVWSGRPFWYFHHMGMGECIGYSTRITQNNLSLYEPGSWQYGVHINLMGDPTLKLHPMKKARNLAVSELPGKILVSWSPPLGDSADGYHVFKKLAGQKRFYQISTSLLTDTQFADTCRLLGTNVYMVRPVRLERSNTGTYWNYGTGTLDTVQVTSGSALQPAPTLTLRLADTVLFCPGLVRAQALTSNLAEPHYFKWYVNGIGVDTSSSGTKWLFISQQQNTIHCELIRLGPCSFPATVSSPVMRFALTLPISATVSIIPRTEVCKHEISRFKANVININSSQFSFQWYKDNALLASETGSELETVLTSNAQIKVKVKSQNVCGRADSVTAIFNAVPADTTRPLVSVSVEEEDTCSATPPHITFRINSNIGLRLNWFKNEVPFVSSLVNPGSNAIAFDNNIQNGDRFQLRAISRKACTTIDTIWFPVFKARVYPSGDPWIDLDSTVQGCLGQPFSTHAITRFGGTSPRYQWYLNNQVLVNATDSLVTLPSLQPGDSLKVRLVSNAPCRLNAINDTAFSPNRRFAMLPTISPTVSLFSDQPPAGICSGLPIRFQALGSGQGSNPHYQWWVNDSLVAQGMDSVFSISTLKNGDTVVTQLTSSAVCAFPKTLRSSEKVVLVLPVPQPLLSLQQMQIHASHTTGDQFQWLLNGVMVPGASDSILMIADSGWYAVVVTNALGCRDTSDAIFVNITSVSEQQNHPSIKLYPNPVSDSDVLFIEARGAILSDPKLFDACGKEIKVVSFSKDRGLNISKLPKGFYTLSVLANGLRIQKGWIKQ